MKTTFRMNERLFNSTRNLTMWNGYRLGMNGRAGVVSKLNDSRNQIAKVSLVAAAIEKLVNKKISVCPVYGQTDTYVEYHSSTGEVKACIVGVDAANMRFTVATADKINNQIIVPVIFAAFLFNDEVRKELKDNGRNVDEIMSYLCDYPQVTENQMIQCCDAFYYAIGKMYFVDYTEDDVYFEAQKKRILQGNLFTHAKETAAPKGIDIDSSKPQQQEKTIQTTLFTEPLKDFMDRCKKGEFVIDYAWNDFQRNAIKPLSFLDYFVPTEEFRELLLSIWLQLKETLRKMNAGEDEDKIMAEPINVQIMGKPGTGKTTMVEAILCALGYPRGFINCKGRSEEDEFEGLNKFINGKVYSIPTKLAEFFSIGGGVLLEEVNLPDPDIPQGAVGQALVYPYVLKVDGYREFKRHPLTIIFGTLNVGTNGTKPMNEGFCSRLDEGCILEDVADDEFKQIVYSTGYPKKHCDTAIKAYKAAMQYLQDHGNDEYCLSITLRGCKKCAQKLTRGFTKEQAIRSAFIAQIYSKDMEVALDLEQCLKRVV